MSLILLIPQLVPTHDLSGFSRAWCISVLKETFLLGLPFIAPIFFTKWCKLVLCDLMDSLPPP